MSQLSQQDEQQDGDCSSTEDRRQRKHDRRSASSSSAPEDRSSQVIVDVAQTGRNESWCINRAGTQEQLREVIGRRVENIAEEWCDVVILPHVADEPRCDIEDRLESVQEARRRAGEQAVVVVNPRSDKSGDSRLRSPKRQRLDAAPDETELTKA